MSFNWLYISVLQIVIDRVDRHIAEKEKIRKETGDFSDNNSINSSTTSGTVTYSMCSDSGAFP